MKRSAVVLLGVCMMALLHGCGSSNADKINQLVVDYKEVLCKSHKLSMENDMSNLSEIASLTSKSLELSADAVELRKTLSESEARDLASRMAQAGLDATAGKCN